ncbi:MFS transporter [Pseudoclavibacter terrae]
MLGIFFGGLLFGWVTDRIGRKKMFQFTLTAFLVCSILQLWAADTWQLFALRLIMGMAVGADYTIAGSMIAEFVSSKKRGPYLAGMIAWWYAGFSLAATFGYLILAAFPEEPDLWRWVLASSAVPALAVILGRIGMPETPRWLARQGRRAEAITIANRYLNLANRQDLFQEESAQVGYSTLFSKPFIRRTLFTSIFWATQVAPFFAIFTFLTPVLDGLGLGIEGQWAEIAFYMVLLVGSFIGAGIINKVGRRQLLIVPYFFQAGAMLLLGLWTGAPAGILVACFITFALFSSASNVLQMLYPSEIFPTAIRATGIGFSAAMSRIGAAGGTFLLPLGLDAWGTGPVMLISAGILVVGLIVSIAWAPETTDMELSASTATGSIPVADLASANLPGATPPRQ